MVMGQCDAPHDPVGELAQPARARRRTARARACASSRSASARALRAPASPSSATNVGLFCAASLPAVLPSVAADPSTSSTSSTTWKARPAASRERVERRGLVGAERAPARGAQPHRGADQRAGLHPVHRLELGQRQRDADGARSIAWPPAMPRAPAASASSAHAPRRRRAARVAREHARTPAPAARRRRAAPSPRRTRRGRSACRAAATSSSMHGRSSCTSEYAWISSTAAAGAVDRRGIGTGELAGGVREQRPHALAAAEHRVAHRVDAAAPAARRRSGSARSSTSSMRRCRSPDQTAHARSGFIVAAVRARTPSARPSRAPRPAAARP